LAGTVAPRFENDFDYQREVLRERIDRDEWDKVDDITRLRNRARGILTNKFGEHDLFANDNLEKLDKLAISHLQLLAALTEYDEYLSLVDPEKIEQELETAQNLAAERVGKDIDQVLANIRDSEILTEELSIYEDLERELDDSRMAELE
jgi:dGTP triphosphohydrolase